MEYAVSPGGSGPSETSRNVQYAAHIQLLSLSRGKSARHDKEYVLRNVGSVIPGPFDVFGAKQQVRSARDVDGPARNVLQKSLEHSGVEHVDFAVGLPNGESHV